MNEPALKNMLLLLLGEDNILIYFTFHCHSVPGSSKGGRRAGALEEETSKLPRPSSSNYI